MEEKYMVNDILDNLKFGIRNLQNAIINCNNVELRQELQNIRNNEENFEDELCKIAESKGYYSFGLSADVEQKETIKKEMSYYISNQ